MKLVCPACGAVCAAEAFLNDPLAREALLQIAALPSTVAKPALSYLALFRTGTRKSLAWAKAVRLLAELTALVNAPHVQWQNKAARPNSSRAWALALEKIVETPPKNLPLKSHGYLTAIAYEIANELDAGRERQVIQAEQSGSRQQLANAKGAAPPKIKPPSFEEMRAARAKTKIGKGIK